MNILITGASGFIASHIVTHLLSEGHQVTCCVRDVGYTQRIFPGAKVITCDFTKDKSVTDWLERLGNIEIVINCVGILYHPQDKVTWSIHYETPKALFDACVNCRVKKIIQISALGIDKIEEAYAKSKRAADEYLLSLPIEAVVLRPSLVYGRGSYGGTSLFRGLAALPAFLPLAGGGHQQLQPIHVEDLAKTVAELVNGVSPHSKLLYAVGPEKITLQALLEQTRRWLGFPPAKRVHVPAGMIKFCSKIGNLIPFSSLNTTSFKMLMQHNIADPAETENFQKQISFKLKGFTEGLFGQPSSVQDRWHARLFLLKPFLRYCLAFIWIYTAICSLFLYPKSALYPLLSLMGITGIGQPLVLFGASIIDALLGLALLFQYKVAKIISIQILLLLIYCVIIAWKLPFLWIDPMGAIAKNIPLMAATLIYWAVESSR